jgi:hypothetical protein
MGSAMDGVRVKEAAVDAAGWSISPEAWGETREGTLSRPEA